MTDQFCQFFNAEIKMQLLASAIELNDSFQKISGFLSQSDEEKIMRGVEAIAELADRHQKFVHQFKKEKAYKIIQRGDKQKKLQEMTKA